MWPSRIERTASATGSLWSSPSTSTVYIAVMLPLPRTAPARSSSVGSSANTDGGYPLVVGGSPAARPTSRCAIAKRVTESISSRTLSPWSRKYSATDVAVYAARSRTARQHAQQRALADAGAAEQANALAAAAGEERVDRAHARRQRIGNR